MAEEDVAGINVHAAPLTTILRTLHIVAGNRAVAYSQAPRLAEDAAAASQRRRGFVFHNARECQPQIAAIVIDAAANFRLAIADSHAFQADLIGANVENAVLPAPADDDLARAGADDAQRFVQIQLPTGERDGDWLREVHGDSRSRTAEANGLAQAARAIVGVVGDG